jgi:mannose-6-phosphate isomerase
MGSPPPYPLILEPILLEKVWGGRRLARYGKRLPEGARIGESWELVDLAQTSPSGGGGGEACSVIANGPLKGQRLADAMALWGDGLIARGESGADDRMKERRDDGSPDGATPAGRLASSSAPSRFPLLLKYLDAQENLSVQVHPSPAYAAAHPGCHLKTEAWYIVEAEPGSVIYRGVRPGVDRDDFVKHVKAGRVVEVLEAVPAVAGECHTLPSGMCHALGAGVLVVEAQTPSDTTFRIYDWGRQGRAMHVEEALECMVFEAAPAQTCADDELASTNHFSMRCGRAGALGAGCSAIMMVRGEGALRWGAESLHLKMGDTALAPAALEGASLDAPAEALWLTVVPRQG